MEILIIGNGFDLEHDLPTSYQSFLEFCNRFYYLEKYSKTLVVKWINNFICKNWEKDKLLQDSVIDNFKEYIEEQKEDKFFELYECIQDNAWIRYFEKLKKVKEAMGGNVGENWIDFEKEISKVIQILDDFRVAISKIDDDVKRGEQFSTSLDKSIEFRVIWSTISFKVETESIIRMGMEDIDQIVSILETELERFIRAFEIYIDEIVNKLPITKKSKDIEKINPDFVLSFNYSNTYERVYGEGKEIEYDYIHGKADTNKNIKTCNLVLGIDEYLEDDRKDTDLEFIAFKKYFQRIYKSTGNAYLKWVDKIKKDYEEYVRITSTANMNEAGTTEKRYIRSPLVKPRTQHLMHTLYIFGHSLDVTDRDILRLFICNDNVQTKIFYHQKDEDDKTTLGKLIKNLVRIMGQDELIRRTGGENKTIEFIPQSKHEE